MIRIVLRTLVVILLGVAPASADIVLSIDVPTGTTPVRQPFMLMGWAIDYPTASSPGIDLVQVGMYPEPPMGLGFDMGYATYGDSRGDVATAYGSQYEFSGFHKTITGMPPGVYRIIVSARSAATGTWTDAVRTVTLEANPFMWIDTPTHGANVTQPLAVSGWALDAAVWPGTGTGVNQVEVVAYLDGGSGSPVSLGNAIYGASRPDVAAAFGAQFASSGFSLTVSGLSPGTYRLEARAHSTVAGAINQTLSVTVPVDAPAAAPVFNPSPNPPPGNPYPSGQTVSMTSSTMGAEIRFTMDGTEPLAGSTLYVAPVPLPSGVITTLKAKAFRGGFAPSTTTLGVYQAGPPDTTLPVITAAVTPPPNAAGWNNSTVVVRFDCRDASGISSCQAPITLSQEGTGQIVTGTAVDNAGNQQTVSVTLNVDRTLPTVTLDEALPLETDTSALSVVASVADDLSGIAAATCNGAPAMISSGRISCNLALAPGANFVIVDVNDVAGNTRSVSDVVNFGTEMGPPATALHVSSSHVLMLVGTSRWVELVDNFGRRVSTAQWTSSDEDVVTVSGGVMTGVAAGTATVVATSGNLSAPVSVNVVAGGTLPSGTQRWRVDAEPGYVVAGLVTGLPEDFGSVYYMIERPEAGGVPRVQALDAAGSVRWSAALPIAPNSIYGGVGNALGGLLMGVAENEVRSIISIGAGSRPKWRYIIQEGGWFLGQGNEDGPVFLFEETSGSTSESWITVIDGKTGAVRARVPLAVSSHEDRGQCAEWPSPGKDSWTGGFQGQIAIDENDVLHFFVRSGDFVSSCTPHPNWSTSISYNLRLELWSITSTGAKSVTPLAHRSYSGPTGTLADLYGHSISPKDGGELILSWQENDTVNQVTNSKEYVALRSVSGGLGATQELLNSGGLGGGVMGENNTAFFGENEEVVARDATTLARRWAVPATAVVSSTAGGGIAVQDGETLKIYDGNGVLAAQGVAALGGRPRGSDGWVRVSPDGRAVLEASSLAIPWARSAFLMPGGSILQNAGPTTCGPSLFNQPPRDLSTPRDYRYTFGSTSPGFSGELPALADAAMKTWRFGGDRGFPGAIEPSSTNPNLLLVRRPVPPEQWPANSDPQIKPEGGTAIFPRSMYTGRPDVVAYIREYLYPTPDASFGIYTNAWNEATTAYGKQYFRYAMMHEFGHVIGMGHPLEEGCSYQESVMTTSLYGDNFLLAPTEKDKAALRRLLGIQ